MDTEGAGSFARNRPLDSMISTTLAGTICFHDGSSFAIRATTSSPLIESHRSFVG